MPWLQILKTGLRFGGYQVVTEENNLLDRGEITDACFVMECCAVNTMNLNRNLPEL